MITDNSLIEDLVPTTSVTSLRTLQTATISDQTNSNPYYFNGASAHFHMVRLKKQVEGETAIYTPVFYQLELAPSFGDPTLLRKLVDDLVNVLEFQVIYAINYD